MTLREWEHLGEQELARYKVFEVLKARRRSPRTGVEIGFFLVRTPDWVVIVAFTEENELVLVRQYRHGTRHFSLELPGGIIDPHERDPAQAAARELREETGFAALELRLLGSMTPNPAIFTNRCHAYLATGCHRIGDLAQDPGEDIEVELVPLDGIDALVQRGGIDHALALAALAFWRSDGSRTAGSGPRGPA